MQSGNCPDDTETVRTTQKLSRQSRNYPDTLETVWIIQKLSGQPENYPDSQQTVRTIQKLFGQSRNCPDNQKNTEHQYTIDALAQSKHSDYNSKVIEILQDLLGSFKIFKDLTRFLRSFKIL